MKNKLLYGYCPICGKPGFSRERRPNGNDKCEAGCTYPSRDAVLIVAPKPPLSASEALFGFAAWLSGRKESIKIGADYEMPPLPQLIGEFCKVNELPEPREGWAENLTHPNPKDFGSKTVLRFEGEDHVLAAPTEKEE